MVADGAVDAPRDTPEPPEGADDDERADTEDNLFCADGKTARGEDEVVEDMCEHQDGEVEGRKLQAKVSISLKRLRQTSGRDVRSGGCR